MKNVVIIGASSGIGRAIALDLAADHRLFLGARRLDRVALVSGECYRQGHWHSYMSVDVSNKASVENFFAEVKGQFGQIDALIIAAGTQGPIGPAHEVDIKAWQDTVMIGLLSLLLSVHYAVPLMMFGSTCITFAGGGAFNVRPNFSAYAVAKAGVVRLTETLAVELAPLGIMVNALSPGFVRETEIHKDTPEEYLQGKPVPIEVPVKCVRWMLSDAAKGITGRTISASFDPWGKFGFVEDVQRNKDLYTMQRINNHHLKRELAMWIVFDFTDTKAYGPFATRAEAETWVTSYIKWDETPHIMQLTRYLQK